MTDTLAPIRKRLAATRNPIFVITRDEITAGLAAYDDLVTRVADLERDVDRLVEIGGYE